MNEPQSPRPFIEKSHRQGDAHLLREIMRTHQALLAVFSREVGMPASRLALMRLLATTSQGTMGVMEIARHLGVNAAAVTRQLQEMEEKHLVVRQADARDRRRTSVRLSAKGRKLFETLHDRSHKLERSLNSVITPEELQVAAKVLAAIRGVLDAMR
jgi:DNA-binding MarR family transcriptional regulator